MPKQPEPAEEVSEYSPADASDIMIHAHFYFAEPFATVVGGMFQERNRQVGKGYNAEHDSQHSLEEWAQMFGQHYREALRLAKTGNEELFFHEVTQGAALYMAAMESLVSNRAGENTTKEAANQAPKVPQE